jgi:hypothetical protein
MCKNITKVYMNISVKEVDNVEAIKAMCKHNALLYSHVRNTVQALHKALHNAEVYINIESTTRKQCWKVA